MKPHLNFITLAVHDLDAALRFYRDGLGWPSGGIVGSEYHDAATGADGTIAFVELQGDLVLALYERSNLVRDASLPDVAPSSVEFSLGYLTESREEVDRLLETAESAGAHVTAPPHGRPWGVYSGYFSDPDGHLWEVGGNPPMSE